MEKRPLGTDRTDRRNAPGEAVVNSAGLYHTPIANLADDGLANANIRWEAQEITRDAGKLVPNRVHPIEGLNPGPVAAILPPATFT